MGDFNLDLLQYNHHTPTQEFIDALFSFAFFPLISNPTRLTPYSATLIGNIFTNNLSQNVLNGVVQNDLSDHLPVVAYFSGLTLTRDGENKALILYASLLTKTCANSTKMFQLQTGPHFSTKILI